MKKCSYLILVGLLLMAGCSRKPETRAVPENTKTPPKSDSQDKIEYWTCSMHLQVRSDKPGQCPICNMDLVPVKSSEAKKLATGREVHLSEEGIRLAGVRTERVERRELAKELLIFGTIGYNFNLHRDVVSLVEGKIEKQWVDFNQTEVKKDDPLVSLFSMEAIQLQEEYLKALRERWLSTFYERDLLTSAVRLSEERLKKIGFSDGDLHRLMEEKSVQQEVIIRAPISGSIVANMVHIGELAKKDASLYHIVPLDEMWFNGQVFEPDLGLLRLGQKIRITTKSYGGEEFMGKLTFIGRALDPISRTILVRFTVPNQDRRLLPNLSASGQIEIPIGKSVLSVPNSAVLDLGTRHLVYLSSEKGVYVPRDVRIGYVTSHYAQILEGLQEGQEVVISGAFLIDAQAELRRGGAASGGPIHGSGSTMNSLDATSQPNQTPQPSGGENLHHH